MSIPVKRCRSPGGVRAEADLETESRSRARAEAFASGAADQKFARVRMLEPRPTRPSNEATPSSRERISLACRASPVDILSSAPGTMLVPRSAGPTIADRGVTDPMVTPIRLGVHRPPGGRPHRGRIQSAAVRAVGLELAALEWLGGASAFGFDVLAIPVAAARTAPPTGARNIAPTRAPISQLTTIRITCLEIEWNVPGLGPKSSGAPSRSGHRPRISMTCAPNTVQ